MNNHLSTEREMPVEEEIIDRIKTNPGLARMAEKLDEMEQERERLKKAKREQYRLFLEAGKKVTAINGQIKHHKQRMAKLRGSIRKQVMNDEAKRIKRALRQRELAQKA